MNAAVTVTDLSGNVLASGTTGANGAYSLGGAISNPPIIVTISSTPTSTFSNGAAFKGELKGLFASGDDTSALMVTVPSSILYKIWDSMGRPSDITAARASAVSLFQSLGMDTSSVSDLWSTSPVGLNYEILQQQLVFICGQDDASGASDIFNRAAALADAYVAHPDAINDSTTGGSVAALVKSYTGYDIKAGGDATTFAGLMALDTVKNTIASNVKAGLTGTSAASQASTVSAVLTQIASQNTNAAAFGDYPGAIKLAASGSGLITNSNFTQVIPYGSGTTAYAVVISGKQVDGGNPTAGAFMVSSMTSGLSASASGSGALTAGTTTFSSGETVTFTVPTSTPGTYSVTVKYTETVSGTARSLSTTFYFKVLGSGVVWATDGDFNAGPETLVFTDTDTSKITSAKTTTTAGTTIGEFKATSATATNFITAFYLPDGMYFVDSGNKFWPNWDVPTSTSATTTKTVTLPASKTIKANKDLAYGEYTWTFRVFDENRDQLLTSSTGTGIAYGSGGANNVRRITSDNYGTSYTKLTYGSSADSAGHIQFDGGSTGNQYITLNSVFRGSIQTWAMAGGQDTGNTNITAGNFYLNVKSSNYDNYIGLKTFGFTGPQQNYDVTAALSAFNATAGGLSVPFSIDLSGTPVNFYPDYGAGLSNIDKIRIGYEKTGGSKSADDITSSGVTFTTE